MNKTDVVKMRIEPQRKQLWKEYAEACMPSLNLTDFLTLAADYFVSGEKYRRESDRPHKMNEYVSSWVLPKSMYEEGYLRIFEHDARQEIERKKERKEKWLAGEYD